ncbi:hypothetical protein BV20DRAFT_1005864 [Pilatotrama ljubarskyi]|nr:hypothetical protein BV20DRAFT_1005864 [Pilatotrama ljubarskyi]
MMHKLVKFPLDEMMAEFLPPQDGEPDDQSFDKLFDAVPTDKLEADMYKALVKAVNESKLNILGEFEFVSTESTPDKTDPLRRKIDCGMYAKGSPPTNNNRTDWSKIELSIECKRTPDADDPFDDEDSTGVPGVPFSDRRRDNLGQIMTYSTLVFERQQRTHHYTLIIFGTNARIVRWDRSGAVYSPAFDYKEHPKNLGRFLWRLSHASAEKRGHDSTACRVLPNAADHALMEEYAQKQLSEGDHARELFAESLANSWPRWNLAVGTGADRRKYLVGKPTFIAPGVVGRGTRGYVALDVTDRQCPFFVYLKDCWRMEHTRSEQEGSILAYLNGKDVRNIPTKLCHGDVGQQCTVSQQIWSRTHKGQEVCPLKTHRHYRLVVKEVGLPLKRFRNGKELVRIFLHCFFAHKDAYEKAKVIHRDISVGNIIMVPIITPDGETAYRGLLTDWELSKRLDQYDLEPRHPDRTGTWQYMSMNALNKPGKQIEVADELESMFHALLWCAIRYLPHNCPNVAEFMDSYFDDGKTMDHEVYWCGPVKAAAIKSGEIDVIDGSRLVFLRKPPPADAGKASGPATLTPKPSGTFNEPYADEQRHPIDAFFTQVLKWFSALYRLQSPENSAKATGTTKTLESDMDVDMFRELVVSEPEPSSSNDESAHELLKKDADKLKNHISFGRLLYSCFAESSWPENDKQPDQLDPDYRPDKEQKVRMKKGTVTDSVKSSMKRSGLHEETFEQSDSKRPRSGSSHPGA